MSSSVTLLSLSNDTLRKSFSYLNAKELATLALTNKYFHQLSDEIVKDIIQEIRSKLFPFHLSSSSSSSTTEIQILSPFVNKKRLLHRLTSTQIYTIGGAFNSDQVNCFLPKSNTWHITPDMKRERENCAVTQVKGYIVAISGESDNSTANAEIFSPLENIWSSLPSLPAKIRGMTCVTMDDEQRVVVIGGQNVDHDETVSSVQILDFKFSTKSPTTSLMSSSSSLIKNELKWVTNENVLLEPRFGHSAVFYDGDIWVAGGSTNTDLYSSSVEILSYKNGSFTSGRMMPSMIKGRRNFKLLVVKDKLYAVGGDDEGSIEYFNVDTNEWDIITHFPSFKQNFSTTTDGENIYIFGGQNLRRSFLSSWECYSVISETWTVTKGKMPSQDSVGFSHGNAITLDFEHLTW